jgi:hypothetical protein
MRAVVQTRVERYAKINDKMKPEETASHYDRVALWWQKQHMHSTYGVTALEKAIQFTENKSTALDIGCGSSGLRKNDPGGQLAQADRDSDGMAVAFQQ